MILKQMIVGSMGVCCYIVACERTGKAAVIDPGGDENKILKEIAANKFTVDAIIATHGHPDHVCGNRRIKEATGARIIMHREDSRFFGRPEVGEYFSMLGMEPSPPVDEEVEDGDIITVGEVQLKVIHTPGHTPGGMCLYCAPDLITGDTLFVGGVGRTDFPGGSAEQLFASIANRLFVLPEETVVWPGHGYGGSRSTIGREKEGNPYF
jgi:glyoxylase-like metal-dependent hydrolase (beta-lactamase superfamily II)